LAILKRRLSGSPNRTLRSRASAPVRDYYLVHVTAVGAAREIIRAGQLEARLCPIFKRNLVYFFALRPAYKLNESGDKHSIIDFFPSVFLVSAEHLGNPFHVYPFDTGGALEEAFDEGASPSFYLEDYELDVSLKAATDHMSWAFGTPADYYDGKLKPDFAEGFPAWEVGPLTFAKIAGLASVGHNRPDRRASAIEIAFDAHVPIERMKFAIFPYQFLEDPKGKNKDMIDRLTAAGVTWDTYEWKANRAPADFYAEINQKVRDHLVAVGQL
jgi:hypothetical protein